MLMGKIMGKIIQTWESFGSECWKKKAIDRIYNYNQLHIISQQYINLVGGWVSPPMVFSLVWSDSKKDLLPIRSVVVDHWCNAQFVPKCLKMGCTSQMAIFMGKMKNGGIPFPLELTCRFPMFRHTREQFFPAHEATHHETSEGTAANLYPQFVAPCCTMLHPSMLAKHAKQLSHV